MIIEDYKRYNIQRIGRDRWGSTQMGQNLEAAGLTVVPIGQGFKSMSEPMKQLEMLVLQKLLDFLAGIYTILLLVSYSEIRTGFEHLKARNLTFSPQRILFISL